MKAPEGISPRREMERLVLAIADYARSSAPQANPNFIVVPNNGEELLTLDGDPGTTPNHTYLAGIDGVLMESLFYRHNFGGEDLPDVGIPADLDSSIWVRRYLDMARDQGKRILAIDFASAKSEVDRTHATANMMGYLSFVAPEKEFATIPDYPPALAPPGVNNRHVSSLKEAENFLYFIAANWDGIHRQAFLNAAAAHNYDVMVVDPFFWEVALTAEELAALKRKVNGGRRLVLAYMSVGEVEPWAYFWDKDWERHKPDWMGPKSQYWESFNVRYWDPDWHAKLYGTPDSYVTRLLQAGFDGVVLDVVDAFERW